jgi:choline-glycine betaine transporter
MVTHLKDIRRVDECPEVDFEDENEIKRFVRPWKWVSVNVGSVRLLRINVVSTTLAIILLWGFVLWGLVAPRYMNSQVQEWKTWISNNFSWFYVAAFNIWAFFLFYVAFSKYGNIKLGRQDEKPEFNNVSWFAMLFSCGIAVGVYTLGVAEPMAYYRGGYDLQGRGDVPTDNERAQQALLQTFYHWGFHAWAPYITVAIGLGLVSYRWNLPLTMRSAFYPLLGDNVYGPVGDIIDAVSITCTTFGVCTSLGLGVDQIVAYYAALADKTFTDLERVDAQTGTIIVMTIVANMSVILGLRRGIQVLSTVTFSLGLFVMLCSLFMDNTWFCLNSVVQSTGHYLQWFIQVGFRTDSFEQLGIEFGNNNLLWGSNHASKPDGAWTGPLIGIMENAASKDATNGATPKIYNEVYASHYEQMMDWWTIFYWGWWVSWAPFVGMFIARISRGRTIRSIVVGAFVAPTLFSFLWLGIWGSLGIKMQRVAELALGNGKVGPSVDCSSLGYAGGVPVRADAIALANDGYFAVACRSYPMLDIMAPFKEVKEVLWGLLLVGITLYFITSSDSGSFVDDIISANGLDNPPVGQKIFWCWTEGAVAIALLRGGYESGQNALGAVQAVSIVAGLPFTLAVCFMCTSVWRALKIDAGEEDISNAAQWSTGTLDIFELFQTGPANEASTAKHLASERLADYAQSIFAPFVGVLKAAETVFGKGLVAFMHAGINAAFFVMWIVFLIMSYKDSDFAWLGWTFYVFMAFQLTYLRGVYRDAYNIYGNMGEDLFSSIRMYPNVVSQLNFQSREEMPANDVYKKTVAAA